MRAIIIALATVLMLALAISMPQTSAEGAQTSERDWTFCDIPLPKAEYSSYGNTIDLKIDAEDRLYVFAEWYTGMAEGNISDWDLVPFDEELYPHMDSVSYTVDLTGNVHLVILDYMDNVIYGTNSEGIWSFETVDDISMIGGGWSWMPKPKIITDEFGHAHLCYQSMDTGHVLRYATNSGGAWNVASIEGAMNSSSIYALNLGPDGEPHLVYWDYATYEMRHVVRTDAEWTVEVIDEGCRSSGVTIDVSTDGSVHVIHSAYIESAWYWDMQCYMKYMTNESGQWSTTVIDWGWGSPFRSISAQLDSSDNMHVSYYEDSEKDLIYATDDGGEWTIERVDAVDYVGRSAALCIDSEDNVHIAYYNETSLTAKYALGISVVAAGTDEFGGIEMFLVATAIAAVVSVAGAFLILRK